jgi:hypothetical protein
MRLQVHITFEYNTTDLVPDGGTYSVLLGPECLAAVQQRNASADIAIIAAAVLANVSGTLLYTCSQPWSNPKSFPAGSSSGTSSTVVTLATVFSVVGAVAVACLCWRRARTFQSRRLDKGSSATGDAVPLHGNAEEDASGSSYAELQP